MPWCGSGPVAQTPCKHPSCAPPPVSPAGWGSVTSRVKPAKTSPLFSSTTRSWSFSPCQRTPWRTMGCGCCVRPWRAQTVPCRRCCESVSGRGAWGRRHSDHPPQCGPAKWACPTGAPEVELLNSRDARQALSIQLRALVIIKTVGASVGILGAWVGGIHFITCRCGASHALGYHWAPPSPPVSPPLSSWSFYKPDWFFAGGNRKGCLFTRGRGGGATGET